MPTVYSHPRCLQQVLTTSIELGSLERVKFNTEYLQVFGMLFLLFKFPEINCR